MATSNEKTIWDYLYGKLGNAYGVAGLMANLYAESGLEPTNLQNTYNTKLGLTDAQYTEKVDDGSYTNFVNDSAGYGLAQWTYYTRKQALKSLATTKKTSIGDLTTQLEYLCNELQNDYSSVWSTLKSATDYTTASNMVLTKFECPSSTSSSVKSARANYAKKYYDKYASTSSSSSTSSSTTITINQNSNFGTHNTSVRSASISYIVMHYCGALGDAQANINYYNQTSTTGASADFFVGYSGDIWQYNPNPSTRYCWAVGGSKLSTKGGSLYGIARNANSISIEMCVRSKGTGKENANDSKWYFEDATISAAVKLVKYLMNLYSVPASKVIRHYDVTGKLCLPTYTEVLTRKGWRRIDEVDIGDRIACADLDNLQITFEEIYDTVPVRTQDTYTNNGLTATKDHRMVYSTYRRKTDYRIDSWGDILMEGKHTEVYIPLAGYSNFDGLPLTDDMIKFYIAVQADGHYMYDWTKHHRKSYYGIEFHLKKQRKVDRIIEILDAINLEYKTGHQSDGTTKIRVYNTEDVNIVKDICEKYLSKKRFTWKWLRMSKEQAKLFLDEIQLWDGCVAGNMYSSSDKRNLDIVSAIAAINGVGSTMSGSSVNFTKSPYMTPGVLDTSTKRNKGKCKHTEVTCVSVKTGIILIRQHGKTFIVGNCPGVVGWNEDSGDTSVWESFKTQIGDTSVVTTTSSTSTTSSTTSSNGNYYRVRKTWSDTSSQKGAFTDLSLAKKCCDLYEGYYVFDWDGNALYPTTSTSTTTTSTDSFVVKVTIDDLNIRTGPGTEYSKTGKFTGKGTFTIVETSTGTGATEWGLLKSYQTNRDGWISLDYVTKL